MLSSRLTNGSLLLALTLALGACNSTPKPSATPPQSINTATDHPTAVVPDAHATATLQSATTPVSQNLQGETRIAEVAIIKELPASTDDTTAAIPQAPAQDTSPAPAGTSEQEQVLPALPIEEDFALLYGNAEYNPVADPTLPPSVQMPEIFDPWEGFNRRVNTFNSVFDRVIARPIARAYVWLLPRPIRLGISNFFDNLGQPANALNALLQGRPKDAGYAMVRFIINSTAGLGGFFNPAGKLDIPYIDEDFGQTLAVWGWRNSRYLELPFFGPRTVRDTFGLIGDAPLSAPRYIERDRIRLLVQGFQVVDLRARLLAIDSMRGDAFDEYILLRDAWSQRRNYQITRDLKHQDAVESNDLPDYLNDPEENPSLPAEVVPIPLPIPAQ